MNIQKDRENILKNINKNRMTAKENNNFDFKWWFFRIKYHNDENINKFLKNIEKESKNLREYFYKIDKRIHNEKIL